MSLILNDFLIMNGFVLTFQTFFIIAFHSKTFEHMYMSFKQNEPIIMIHYWYKWHPSILSGCIAILGQTVNRCIVYYTISIF